MVQGNILVTGGLGFLGSHIVNLLAGNSDTIVVYDIRAREYSSGNMVMVNGDIFDMEHLVDVIRDNDVNNVIHMVGLASISACRKNSDLSFRLNVLSVQNVLEAMRLTDVDRLVFPSTAAVYGIVNDPKVREETTPNPVNIYGFHKLAAENLIKGYNEEYGFNSTILRLFNVYGDLDKEQGVISIFIKRAMNKEPLRVYGGDQLRDFIHVNDVASIFSKVLNSSSANRKIINVGTGIGISIKEIAEMVRKTFPNANVVYEKSNEKEYSIYADISLLKSLINIDIADPRIMIPRFIEDCRKRFC